MLSHCTTGEMESEVFGLLSKALDLG